MLISYFCPGVQLMCGVTVHWYTGKTQVSVANIFLVRSGTWCLLTLLSAGILSGLNLCGSCRCWHRPCVFMFIHPVASGRPVSSEFSTSSDSWSFPHPFFHIDPWALREGFDDDIPFRTDWHKIPLSADCPVVGLHVCPRLRQEAALLMSAK